MPLPALPAHLADRLPVGGTVRLVDQADILTGSIVGRFVEEGQEFLVALVDVVDPEAPGLFANLGVMPLGAEGRLDGIDAVRFGGEGSFVVLPPVTLPPPPAAEAADQK